MPTPAQMTDAWTLQLSNDARDGRMHDGAFLLAAPGSYGLAARAGVIPSYGAGATHGALHVAPSDTPSLQLRIAPGPCVINRVGLGPWTCYLDHTAVVTLDSGHAANPRIDLIVARIYDHDVGDPDTGPHGPWIDVIPGTPGPVPVVPTLPDGAIPLAQVTVGAGAEQIGAGQIVDARRSAWPRGGPRPLMQGDDPGEPGTVVGEQRDRAGLIERWSGTSWTILADLGGSVHGRYVPAAGQPLTQGSYTPLGFSITQEATPLVIRSGGNSVFTVQRTGLWRISAGVRTGTISPVGDSTRFLRIISGGIPLASEFVSANAAVGCSINVSTTRRLSAGAQLSIEVYQNSGSLSTINPGTSEETNLSLEWAGS